MDKKWLIERQGKDDHFIERPPRPVARGCRRVQRLHYKPEDRGYKTPCWIYQGYINPLTGYGAVGKIPAYRLAYECVRGSIPAGLEPDHLCRVRACINPDHLEPVTRSEDARRGLTGRQPKIALRALTEEQERAVLSSPLSNRALAPLYGCSHEAIRQARLRAKGTR